MNRAFTIAGERRRSKYGNRKTVVDGVSFHSVKEARRYSELKLLERAGAIRDLKLQPAFPLDVNGVPITRYVADFSYVENGKRIVEDVKGYRTKEYQMKAKLMLACHGVEVRET